ncbi:MAG: hypothetical protein CL677_00970 [Bdellovibrionaceae bacterium]|nr:hypothetical protein [Pseudobdellovibrionaceae bacterium]
MKKILFSLMAASYLGLVFPVSAQNLVGDISFESVLLAENSVGKEDFDVVVDAGDDWGEGGEFELEGEDPGDAEFLDEEYAEEPQESAPVAEEEPEMAEPLPTAAEQAREEIKMAEEESSEMMAQPDAVERKTIKAGMKSLKRDCNMRANASLSGDKIKILHKGKRLWVEPHNNKWVKVFRKSGPAFVGASCF